MSKTNPTQNKYRRLIDEPNMSDKTLLLSIEDLINRSFGTVDQNTVNFKMIQTVLHILARQMRILGQEVEIKRDDIEQSEMQAQAEKEHQKRTDAAYSSSESDEEAERRDDLTPLKGDKDRDMRGTERGGGKDKQAGKKDRDREGKSESKDKDKADQVGSKDRDKADGGGSRDKEKADRDGSKDKDKADRGGSKDKDKADRGGSKARDKTEGGGSKDKEKADRGGSKDKDKADRGRSKDRDKADRGRSKDKDKADKTQGRDTEGSGAKSGERGGRREKRGERGGTRDEERGGDRGGIRDDDVAADRGADKGGRRGERGKKGSPDSSKSARRGRDVDREGSRTSIIITEADRAGGRAGQDKILVVEKGPTTRAADYRPRVGSIEVVTASQFALLEKAVKELQTVAGPLPVPALPDNKKLRMDLAKGTASLTDTMQAMQLNARVQAAEQALTRMAGLLTQLAAAGSLPDEMKEQIGQIEVDLQEIANAASAIASAGARGTAPGSAGFGSAGPGSVAPGTVRPGSAGPGNGGPGSAQTRSGSPAAGRKSVAIDPVSQPTTTVRPDSGRTAGDQKRSMAEMASTAASRSSTLGRTSVMSRISAGASAGTGMSIGVTRPEMENVLQMLKEDLIKYISAMTAKSAHSSEVASSTAKSVADRLDIALKLDKRITILYSQTADYAEQLSGFDSGLTTQMASFHEQMLQMRIDLKAGLIQLEQANNNAETAALVELNERYEILATELDNTLHTHQGLNGLQKQLSDELRSLVECVEMLREQKADRDEVFDGLKDKADITRLKGLLHDEDFTAARIELDKRLELCYEKFRKQDRVWLGAIKDLTTISEGKAEIMTLLAIKDNATDELRTIQETLRKLYIMLGEPKAAVLMRKLAKDAACAACLVPALMEPTDPAAAMPHLLPSLRPAFLADDVCYNDIQTSPPPDTREHVCRRWVGGSHTLMSDHVTRERAGAQQLQTLPTKRYTGYGVDGKLYMLEEELQPCLECNQLNMDDAPQNSATGGAGDQGVAAEQFVATSRADKGTGDTGVNESTMTTLAGDRTMEEKKV